jgi:hypothetical protein
MLRGYIDMSPLNPMKSMVGWQADLCVSLCHMDTFYDTQRATGSNIAEHRTLRCTAAGNFDCKLHQTTSTVRMSVRKTVEIWYPSMTMFYFTPRLGDYREGVLERFFALREELSFYNSCIKKKQQTDLVDFLCNEKKTSPHL